MSEIEERLLAELARAKGMSITALKMSMAVTASDMADIRSMARRDVTVPSSAIEPQAGRRPVVRGNGWCEWRPG